MSASTSTSAVDSPAAESPRSGVVAPQPRRRRKTLRRVLLSLGALGLVAGMLAAGGLLFVTDRYAGNLTRVGDVFAGLDQSSRPAAPSATAQGSGGAAPVTFLLVGSD